MFSLSINGTNPTYDWEYNTATLGAASIPNYTLVGTLASDAGNYRCKITNICGDFYSNEVQLKVNTTTGISAQPSDILTCEGSDASFSVTANGSNLSYAWYKDGIAIIPAETNSALNLFNITAANNGFYHCEVSGSCGIVSSALAQLNADIEPTITSQPGNQTGCIGEPLNIITTAGGSNLLYNWYKDGVLLPTETNPVIGIASFAAGDDGSYYCIISNTCGNQQTNNAIISLGSTTVVNTYPVSATRCIHSSVVFTVSASGTNLSYQWYKDGIQLTDDGRITASNTPTLSITDILMSDFGEYTCNVTGDCGLVTSNGATLTVRRPPVIITAPVSDTVCQGGLATFNVLATGDNLSYQWQVDGTPIAGATNTSLVINPATSANQGIYNCQVFNTACGLVTSAAADLVVFDNLLITDPTPVTSCEGNSVSFNVVITGPPNYDLALQWYTDGIALSNGGQITGAYSDILNISNITSANSGSYQCEVTSRCGSAMSNIATLTIEESVTITVQPVSFSVAIGNTANFTVIAVGNITAYQWRKNSVGLVDGGDISGANTAILSIANADVNDEGAYSCLITGLCSNASSKPADLTVLPTSIISVQPVTPVTKCEKETLNLSVTSTATTYEWRKDGTALIEGGDISGSNSASLTISNLTTSDQGAYTCNVDGIETSQPSIVTINASTIITLQPISYTHCEGDNVTFNINATGTSLVYQWQKDNVDILGATNNTLSINPLIKADEGNYHCIVTGTCGSLNSNPAYLTVNCNTLITSQPLGGTICENTSLTLSVGATGNNLTYQWYQNGSPLANGGSFTGVSTANLNINNATTADAASYSCLVQGDCNSENSHPVVVNVTPLVTISNQPINRSICENNSVTLNVAATGTITGYQWYKDGTAIPLANSNSYNIANILGSDAGAYFCEISGTCNTLNSNSAVLTVLSPVNFSLQPTNLTVCEDNLSTITLNATGAIVSYQWQKNSINLSDDSHLSGSTTNSIKINPSTSSDEGVYRCFINSTCGNTASNSIQLTVDDSTHITLNPTNLTIVEGSTAWFNTSATGTNLTYQWQCNGVDLIDGGDISGATKSILAVANVSFADQGAYQCVITGDCGNSTTNQATLTIDIPVVITNQPANLVCCSGESASFSVTASGTGLTYQWKHNGSSLTDNGIITGSTTANLIITSTSRAHGGSYSCSITGSFGIANSIAALLTINETVAISTQPISQTKCENDNLVLEVSASGNNLTYQWSKDDVNLTNNAQISGSNNTLLVITNLTSANSGTYRCTVSNSCNTEYSDPAVVTIYAKVAISTQPISQTRCVNQTANFTITATGTNLTYQWYKNGSPLSNGGNISGVTSANLIISNLVSSNAGNYSCFVTDNCISLNSSVAQLIIQEITNINTQPLDKIMCEGSNAFFEVEASGTSLSYQWQKDGINLTDGATISGATQSVLVMQSIISSNAGVYRCTVSGGCNNELSNPANLTVNLLPTAGGTIAGSSTLCQGEQSVLYVVPEISNSNSYIWTLPYGATITEGSGTRSILVDFSETALSGTISVHGNNTCGTGTESPAKGLTINQLPTANAGADQIVCSESATFNANAVVGTWSKYTGDGIIVNTHLYNSSVNGLLEGDNQFIWLVTQNGCTASDTVLISNIMVTVNAGEDQIVCSKSTNLGAIAPANGAFWSVISGTGFFDDLYSPTSLVTGLAQGTNQFAWTVNNQGCIQSDIVDITNDRPLIPNGGADQIIDYSETYMDADPTEAGTTGTWSV